MRIVLFTALLLTGCSNWVSGTVDGKVPFNARSALYFRWPPTAVEVSTLEPSEHCAAVKNRQESSAGGMLISGLSSSPGTNTVVTDLDARAGKAQGTIVRYYAGPDARAEANWQGTITITNVATEAVRGEFDLQAESGQLRGNFNATPCLQ